MFVEDVPPEFQVKSITRVIRVINDDVCTGDCEYCKLYMDIGKKLNDVRRAVCSVSLMRYYIEQLQRKAIEIKV